jgi:hypothetical protein
MITADGGGSNGSRVRLWKIELQKLADETGLTIGVCHYPPGTSKMEQDRASPVLSHHAELAWAAADQPNGDHRIDRGDDDETGLTVRCELDENTYAKGVKVSDAEMAALNISGDAFHPEWNYTIAPRSMPAST